MKEKISKSQRFNHRFTTLQILSLFLSFPFLLNVKYKGDLNFFLILQIILLYIEFGINYLLEKFYRNAFEKEEKRKAILESWALAFIAIHISILIFILAQIQFNIYINSWIILFYLIFLHISILLIINGRTVQLPNYPITEKLHKIEFVHKNKAHIIFFVAWVIHFTREDNTVRLIALIIAFIAFVYHHLAAFVKLKDMEELERQIKLEQMYLGFPIAAGLFYLFEFVSSSYNLGFSATGIFWLIAGVFFFISFIVRKKYE